MFWSKKNEITSIEYEKLSKRVIELFSELEDIKVQVKILGTNYDNLRGNFNRKLAGVKKEEETEKTEKDINKSVFLSPNGSPI